MLRIMLWPKEHGAYGQVSLPLVTALLAGGVSSAGVWLAVATLSAFLAHEPLVIVLGHRGPRALREQRRPAIRMLMLFAAMAVAAGVRSLALMPAGVRWSLAVPLVPAVVLVATMFRDVEKSSAGEVAASLVFAGVAVPVMTASGADPRVAVAAAIPFALFFVTSTLSVRVAIARVRGGGHPAIVAATRRAALLVAAGGAVLLAVAVDRSLLPFSALATSMPGLLTATGIAMRPPPPAKLRVVGWMLVAVSVLTAFGVLVTSAHGRCGEPVTDAEFIRLC